MAQNCRYCGQPLEDGATFCSGCGATIETFSPQTRCINCGGTIEPGTSICPACGAVIYSSAGDQASAGPAEMESLVPPVITDDMFSTSKPKTPEVPAMDAIDGSAYGRPQQPAPQQQIPRPAPQPAPQQIPRPAAVTPPPLLRHPQQPQAAVPQNDPAPQSNEVYNSRSSAIPAANTPQPTPVIPPNAGGYQQQGYQQGYPRNYGNQPMHSPYPDPANMNVQEGRKAGSIVVPIILILLILGVLIFDIFFLFRDRIFGSDDSSKKAKKDIAVVYDTGELI
ncbi:MAG: zinc ribbon domain-containing protein [Ruminococcus sp.]|nr:zinc ribbon domain-containing protein [Ruminococcus sp.]